MESGEIWKLDEVLSESDLSLETENKEWETINIFRLYYLSS